MSDNNSQTNSSNSSKDISVQDTIKSFKLLSQEDQAYFVNHMPSAALEEMLRAARQEEKNKLYPDLNKSKQTVAELQAELQAMRDAVEQEKASKMTFEQLVNKKNEDLLKMLSEKEAEFAKQIQDFDSKLRESQLRAYKAETVKALNVPKHLEKYVMGDTEEAITQAAEMAIATFNDIKAEFSKETITVISKDPSAEAAAAQAAAQKQQANPLPEQRMDTTFVPVSPDVNASQVNEQQFTDSDIQKMTAAQYAQNREKILSQMRDRLTPKLIN